MINPQPAPPESTFPTGSPEWEQYLLEQIQNKPDEAVLFGANSLAAIFDRPDVDRQQLQRICSAISAAAGPRAICNTLDRCQLLLGLRRPRIAVYDHTWHFIGGAQKYGAIMAEALSSIGEITLIGNRPFCIKTLNEWYRLDLNACSSRVIPMPFFEDRGGDHIDPAVITTRAMENPFHAVSRASLDYDLFINNSTVEMVCPLSCRSAIITHFPERRPRSFFYSHRYDRIVFNSLYTRSWIEKRWGLTPHTHLYPPVDMPELSTGQEKKPIILSVARFDMGGNKQQLDMLRAFDLLLRSQPRLSSGWRLILAGGSYGDNPYLRQVEAFIKANPQLPVDLRVNTTHDQLTELYHQASLFWHFCGLGQNNPALVEHFGMTVAEAMRSGCIPLVFDGGGMREIVKKNSSGHLFSSISDLLQQTTRLLADPASRDLMAQTAQNEGRRFSKEVFADRSRALVEELLGQTTPDHAAGL